MPSLAAHHRLSQNHHNLRQKKSGNDKARPSKRGWPGQASGYPSHWLPPHFSLEHIQGTASPHHTCKSTFVCTSQGSPANSPQWVLMYSRVVDNFIDGNTAQAWPICKAQEMQFQPALCSICIISNGPWEGGCCSELGSRLEHQEAPTLSGVC